MAMPTAVHPYFGKPDDFAAAVDELTESGDFVKVWPSLSHWLQQYISSFVSGSKKDFISALTETVSGNAALNIEPVSWLVYSGNFLLQEQISFINTQMKSTDKAALLEALTEVPDIIRKFEIAGGHAQQGLIPIIDAYTTLYPGGWTVTGRAAEDCKSYEDMLRNHNTMEHFTELQDKVSVLRTNFALHRFDSKWLANMDSSVRQDQEVLRMLSTPHTNVLTLEQLAKTLDNQQGLFIKQVKTALRIDDWCAFPFNDVS